MLRVLRLPPRFHDVLMLVACPVGETFKLNAHPCRFFGDLALRSAEVEKIDVGGHRGGLPTPAVWCGFLG
jgi:hypothetical protein